MIPSIPSVIYRTDCAKDGIAKHPTSVIRAIPHYSPTTIRPTFPITPTHSTQPVNINPNHLHRSSKEEHNLPGHPTRSCRGASQDIPILTQTRFYFLPASRRIATPRPRRTQADLAKVPSPSTGRYSFPTNINTGLCEGPSFLT